MIFTVHTMKVMPDWIEWRLILQENEVGTMRPFLSDPPLKILEIGGGDGIKSMILHKLGYDVKCVDINPWEKQYYAVSKIEPNRLPFESKTFDVIISANVIPFVLEKNNFFKEIDRVLKDDGISIHVVPSEWWSIFTNFWHYVFIPKYLARSILPKKGTSSTLDSKDSFQAKDDATKASKIKKLFLHPLANNPSFIHEIFYFSKNSWIKLFNHHGYRIVEVKNEPLFFTAYGVFRQKYLKSRKFLGALFPTQYYFKIVKNS